MKIVETLHCKNCGAPLKYKWSKCEYCDSDYKLHNLKIDAHKFNIKSKWLDFCGNFTNRNAGRINYKFEGREVITLRLYGKTKCGQPAIVRFKGEARLLKGRDSVEVRDFHHIKAKSVAPKGIDIINPDFEDSKELLNTLVINLNKVPRFEQIDVGIAGYSGPCRRSYKIREFEKLFVEVSIGNIVVALVDVKKLPNTSKGEYHANVLHLVSRGDYTFEFKSNTKENYSNCCSDDY